MGGGIAVVALGEVAVVAGDDGVGHPVVEILAVPLADAWAAGVGQNRRPKCLEVGQEAVAFDGGPDLFGPGGDEEGSLGCEALGYSVACNAGGPCDVLVAGVGARTDEACAHSEGPAVCLGLGAQVGDRTGEIRGVGSVDVW